MTTTRYDLNALVADINDYIEQNALSYEPQRAAFRKASALSACQYYTCSELADVVWVDYRNAPLHAYKVAARQLFTEKQQLRHDEIVKNLCDWNEDQDLAQVELKRMIKLMAREEASEEELQYYFVAWLQFIWQIKRRLKGLPTSWEIMLSLVSRTQGSGKTETCKRFGEPLEELFKANADCSIFTDPFRVRTLQNSYLILLDEFDSASRTQLSAFKRYITSATFSARQIYTDIELEVERNASFLVTSNRSIAHDIMDDSMRRFAEMRCRESKANATFIAKAKDINWDRIWGAADHTCNVAPAAEHAAIMDAWQAQLNTPSEFSEWVGDCLKKDEVGCAPSYVKVRDAYRNYMQWCSSLAGKPMDKRNFKRYCLDCFSTVNTGNYPTIKGYSLSLPEQCQ